MGADDASRADMPRPILHPSADPLALDEETVERLLAGDLPLAEAPPGYTKVAALLAAAAAEPTPEELAGQSAALAELRAVTRPRRASRSRRAARPARRRWAGLAAVALLGALVTGGAAAATGGLPEPVRDVARSILGTAGDLTPALPARPGQQPSAVAPTGDADDPAAPPPGSKVGGSTPLEPGTSAAGPAAQPDREGLCRAYLASLGKQQGRKMEASAFALLARAAGGEHMIPAYCDGSQASGPKSKDQKQPGPPEDEGQGQGQNGSPPVSGGNQGQGEPQSPSSSRSPAR